MNKYNYKTEAEIQQKTRELIGKFGGRLYRNNKGAYKSPVTGQFIRYGLCNDTKALSDNIKSHDLIGLIPYTIKYEDVGKVVGVFLSLEAKKPGWVYKGTQREKAQEKWAELIRSMGGIADFISDPDDLYNILERGLP